MTKAVGRDIHWDHDTIRAFWDAQSQVQSQDHYFGRQRGRSVLKAVRRRVPVEGRVVDFGCGLGYFIEHLLDAGIACEGADLSPESVAAVNDRLSGHPLFRGARVAPTATTIPVEDGSADVIFFLETIEHVLEQDLERCIDGLRAALRTGGHVVVTTPHREDLERGKVVCEACGCRFHRMQHVASFSRASLEHRFHSRGFETAYCRATLLLPNPRIYARALRARTAGPRCPMCGGAAARAGVARRLAPRVRLPRVLHLLYIGRKS